MLLQFTQDLVVIYQPFVIFIIQYNSCFYYSFTCSSVCIYTVSFCSFIPYQLPQFLLVDVDSVCYIGNIHIWFKCYYFSPSLAPFTRVF